MFDVSVPKEKAAFYKAAKAENHGAGVDAVLEMSGSYHAYEDAFEVLRMGGEMSLLGLTSGAMPSILRRMLSSQDVPSMALLDAGCGRHGI